MKVGAHLENAAIELPHRGLASSWVAQKNAIQRSGVRCVSGELAVVVGDCQFNQILHLFFHRCQPRQPFELSQRPVQVRESFPVRPRAYNVDSGQVFCPLVAGDRPRGGGLEQRADSPGVAKALAATASCNPAGRERDHFARCWRPKIPTLLFKNLAQLVLVKVFECNGVRESSRKAVVPFKEPGLHVVFVPGQYNCERLPPLFCHIQQLHCHRCGIGVGCRVERVGLVDEQRSVCRAVNQLAYFARAHPTQLFAGGNHECIAGADAELVKELANELAHSGFAGARVAHQRKVMGSRDSSLALN